MRQGTVSRYFRQLFWEVFLKKPLYLLRTPGLSYPSTFCDVLMYSALAEWVYKRPLIVYADTAYCINSYRYPTVYGILVTHISQLVNFTVRLGKDKETVPANRNYTKLPAGQ